MIQEDRPGPSANERPDARPFWVPAGVKFDKLPREAQAALKAIIQPAYRELVLEAASALERSAGLTVVHLLWLEIIDQLDLGQQIVGRTNLDATPLRNFDAIAAHLKIISAKIKTSNFLLKLKSLQAKLDTISLGAEAIRSVHQALSQPQAQSNGSCEAADLRSR